MEKSCCQIEKGEQLTMQEVQRGAFEVLKKFKEICEKQGLKYFLCYGTLLGAVRHNGFIPWDDDVDVMMPREDYEKLLEYFSANANELKPLELIHYSVNKKYVYPITRISDSRYILDYEGVKDYGLGLFIDVYPLDGVNPLDKKHLKKLDRNIKFIMMHASKEYIPSKSKLKNFIKRFVVIISKLVSLSKRLKRQDKLAQKYDYKSSAKVCCTTWELKEIYDKDDFENTVEHDFETAKFKIPSKYDKLLKQTYGDYMQLPPEENRIGHHFYTTYKRK